MKTQYFVSVIFKIKLFLKQNFCFYPNLKKDTNTLFHRDTTVI